MASASQRYAGMLLSLLAARDHQLACNLDLDVLLEHQASTPHLPGLQQALRHTAGQLQILSMALQLVGLRPTFAIGERLADTLLGALLAWLFSYVLPSWERNQIPGLVKRSIKAQSQHAKLALALLSTEQSADLNWRLARREAFDSLSALTLATQRSLAEPRHVRPPLEPLEVLQARSDQLLAQLTAVKSLLLLRRQQLDLAQATPALAYAAQCIVAELSGAPMAQSADRPPDVSSAGQPYVKRPDPLLANDLTPWLLRRLQLACVMARELRLAASRVRV